MNPESDSRADRLDEALERQRSGDESSIDDRELQELLLLASRLERDLPRDIPDPAFRENLKYQVLQGSVDLASQEGNAPVDLAEERWHRRVLQSPWRVSAAAAACLVVIVVAFVAADGPFGGSSDSGNEDVTSFAPVDSDGTSPDQSPLDVADDAPTAERWFTATFPPFDVEHMVLPPILIGFLPLSERRNTQVELLGLEDMVDDIEIPDTSTVYYFNSPPDAGTILTNLASTLGISGELIEGNGDGTPYRIVDDAGNDIMRWDMTSAFFHFRGDILDDPIDDLLDPGAEPSSVARRFLELIGFDMHTIEYEQRIAQNGSITEVQLRPIDFPDTGLEVTLGGSVFVGEHGEILEAQLYWLSLVDAEVVPLRDVESVVEEIQAGNGYAPPATSDSDEVMIEVEDMHLVHVLTRLGEANFVLQPAIKVVGDYGNGAVSEFPGPARYLVPAADTGD